MKRYSPARAEAQDETAACVHHEPGSPRSARAAPQEPGSGADSDGIIAVVLIAAALAAQRGRPYELPEWLCVRLLPPTR